MDAHKLQVKLFAQPGATAKPEDFIPVFHGWIKKQVLKELMIDVANYAHVPDGPGVVLIGHGSDYFMDEGEGRLGLLYSRKRAAPEPPARLQDAFRRALHAAILLEKEPALAGKLSFRTDEWQFRINDRLQAPNDEATFARVKAELESFAGTLFAGAGFEIARLGDGRQLFTARIKTAAPASLAVLLDRIGGAPPPDGSKPS